MPHNAYECLGLMIRVAIGIVLCSAAFLRVANKEQGYCALGDVTGD